MMIKVRIKSSKKWNEENENYHADVKNEEKLITKKFSILFMEYYFGFLFENVQFEIPILF